MSSRGLLGRSRIVWAAAGLIVLFHDRAIAAPAYMRIDGIPCEATSTRYTDWCEVLSFSFGGSTPGLDVGAGGASTSRAALSDVAIVKPIDRGTPRIFEYFAAGRHLRDVTITFVKTIGRDEVEYLRIELFDCVISKVSYGFAQEGVSIFWIKLKMTYRQIRPDGSIGPAVTSGWDRSKNQPAF